MPRLVLRGMLPRKFQTVDKSGFDGVIWWLLSMFSVLFLEQLVPWTSEEFSWKFSGFWKINTLVKEGRQSGWLWDKPTAEKGLFVNFAGSFVGHSFFGSESRVMGYPVFAQVVEGWRDKMLPAKLCEIVSKVFYIVIKSFPRLAILL